jgi:chemotaxis protein MotB
MRKPLQHHVNHDRWLVSYADFITLLFAFFVVMFATTHTDSAKAKAVSESVRDALEHGQLSATISTVLGRGRHEARNAPLTNLPADAHENPGAPADLPKYLATLSQGLDAEVKSGKLQLKLDGRGLVISLREATFFGSGDDTLSPACLPILERIAVVVHELPNAVRVEGHTDSVPIHNSRFHNNWELSAARSIVILEVMRDRFGIPPARMSVAGFADNVPSDTNDTEEGRAHNRRVDLVLLSVDGPR